MKKETPIKIINGTGQPQEIHCIEKTIRVEPGEKYDLFLSSVNRAELSRIRKIFTEIVSDKDSTVRSDINKSSSGETKIGEVDSQVKKIKDGE